MPLSEAEREILTNEADQQLPKAVQQWIGWTDALYRLWLQRTGIAVWALLGVLVSIPFAWRLPKKSGVIAITVRDRGAELARAMVNAYLEELDALTAKVSTSAARRERIFIEQRLT